MSTPVSAIISKSLLSALTLACANLAFAQSSAPAAAPADAKPAATESKALACDSLKQTIDEKLTAKGVKNYQLDIVDSADIPTTSKVVGSCDGGKHKIVYVRESSAKN